MRSTTMPRKLRFPLSAPQVKGDKASLPSVLSGPISRAAGGGVEELLPNVTAVQTWPLAQTSRSGTALMHDMPDADNRLLALEAADGTTIFIRADALAERVARVRPEAVDENGLVDLDLFRDPEAASRGLGDWLWKQVTELKVEPDQITDLAKQKLSDWLRDTGLGKLEDTVVETASTMGAKALMEAIEERLASEPGLYQWQGGALQPRDLCRNGDARLGNWAGKPALLFIHGTGSHTLGSFGGLPGSDDWRALAAIYEDRVFGLEHRTFSLGPIDNALVLAEVLPTGATIHLVTHSRGGLVGDLLCLGGNSQAVAELIGQFRRQPRPDEAEREAADVDGALKKARETVSTVEQDKLRRLVQLLDDKALKVERYVRVASPAAGTALLSDSLDLFLSGLLELVRRGGAWAAGAAAGAVAGALSGGTAGPAAAKLAKEAFDRGLKLLARVVVEIADKRLQPQLVPGIEAMLPESPIGEFLARVPRRPGVAMAVIAGEIEGGGVLKRLGVMFTDWMFFDRADNDLVVDTRSMYGGVAGQGAYALFDQGAEVNHFAYFRNRRTRSALRNWLAGTDPRQLPEWTEMQTVLAERAALARGETEPPPNNTRPVVIYLPGIMGSHLEVDRKAVDQPGSGDRIWLDPIDLAAGRLRRIAIGRDGVAPDDMVDLAYGKLARHLEQTHRVIRFAYDWRLPNEKQVELLADVLRDALKQHPDQPVRILAHSMGGLVTRATLAQHPDLWAAIVKREGGRLVMLGTPNHGSHLMVETLLGRSDTMRMLARLDLRNGLQHVLDIVAGYPGALQLLPRPGFRDAGGDAAKNFFDPVTWQELAGVNNDWWFGKHLGGQPTEDDLTTAKDFWTTLVAAPALSQPERVAYVYGQAENTPCGLKLETDADGQLTRLAMLGTPQGDGSVSWASGKLDWLPDDRYWMMPADHSGLVNTPDYFDEVDALLATGRANRLGRLPAARGEAAAPIRAYQPGPMPGYPSERELVAALVGGHARPIRPKAKRPGLTVSVRAGDLRCLSIPVLCGHYIGDPIAGAEWVIDRDLVGGALGKRERLGVHAGPLGTTSVVLMPRSREEVLRGTGQGTLIVGLGEFGSLSAGDVRETVRAGVLRLLLHAADRQIEQASGASNDGTPLELRLASVLIGYNSTTSISVDESVAAVTLGVAEANKQFVDGAGGRSPARIGTLEFIEQYEDVAITAAYAVNALPQNQARALDALGLQLTVGHELEYGLGVRPRLSVGLTAHYWPRLMVTDAERSESGCPAECYEVRVDSPIPEEARAALLAAHGCNKNRQPGPGAATPAAGASAGSAQRYPNKLKYLFLSERARAETVVQLRQPGLIEKLVAAETSRTAHNAELGLGRTLFQLLVPLGFKSTARETSNLMLVLDAYTANLPWEMLIADGEPMVLNTRVVRQLATKTFRPVVRGTRQLSAYVVCNPSTEGYYAEFGGNRPPVEKEKDRLNNLQGAEDEGNAIAGLLEGAGYQVERAPGGSRAAEVIGRLFKKPYRVLVVSAHGMFQVTDRQGNARSGVVLSDGMMLTAAEVGQMEVVPELVFLSCCHLGEMTPDAGWAPNKLAYSLAREMIEMGVRCVVAAGWEVDDQAARTFATCFFECFVNCSETFGEALFKARTACYAKHPEFNTWGAYQAYGDPAFTLGTPSDGERRETTPISPAELVDWLHTRRLEIGRKGSDKSDYKSVAAEVKRRLAAVPAPWSIRPDLLCAIAGLHGAFGEEGFAAACAAYLGAISADTSGGTVPLAAIEQLANLEARSAEKLARRVDAELKAANIAEARARVKLAIARLEGLLKLAVDSTAHRPNTERWSLLGSAHKSMAVVLREAGEGWDKIRLELKNARKAYANGEGDPSAPDFNPYAMINRLHLDALLDMAPQDFATSVEQCQAAARRRFGKSFNFWDGVMTADAELAGWLACGKYSDDEVASAAAILAGAYWSEVKILGPEPRQFESVVRQIDFLADLFAERLKSKGALAGDSARVEVLRELIRRLKEPSSGPAANQPVDAGRAFVDSDGNPAPQAANVRKVRRPKGKADSN
jgi:CHAT domain-containing protein/pimeloyl-ACP methyl ester carboxylesterase